jgi:hypothetical protein
MASLLSERAPRVFAAPESDGFTLNRHRALDLWWSMILFGKPASTFPDHALVLGRFALVSVGAQNWRERPPSAVGSQMRQSGDGLLPARAAAPVQEDCYEENTWRVGPWTDRLSTAIH